MARILTVEDDPDTQRDIGTILYREGYEVHYAWNGQEGFEKVLRVDPDLVLLDMVLPVLNGAELLKKLSDSRLLAGLPVVVISGVGDDQGLLKTTTEALGVVDYLPKPVMPKELVAVVKRALEAHPRARGARPPELRRGEVSADPRFLTVTVNDRLAATFTEAEFTLVRLLIERGAPVPRPELLRALGYQPRQIPALKQLVRRVRIKLGAEARRLRTSGSAYSFVC